MPTITASTTTCSNSPLAKAPTKLSGTMCTMNSRKPCGAALATAGGTAPEATVVMPWPICSRLPANRPSISAIVETISK